MSRISLKVLEELEKKVDYHVNKSSFTRKIGIHDSTGKYIYTMDASGNRYETENFDVKLTDNFLPLFSGTTTVSIRGGRGSGKSIAVGIALLLLGVEQKHKVLCFREVQGSISGSVYSQLIDQIQQLHLEDFYTWTKTEIRGLNGTVFIFHGLSDLTAANIKSLYGITLAWGEEAGALSDNSLTIFVPTIRDYTDVGTGVTVKSRIFFTWNPETIHNPMYKRYVALTDNNVTDVVVNYKDAPWFPEILENLRQRDERMYSTSPSIYRNIWEGQAMAAVDGAIYFEEMTGVEQEGRIQNLHYDPKLKVHLIWDLGFSDAMAIIFVQKTLTELRVIDYIEDSRKTYEFYNGLIRSKPYSNWGTVYLPHDGRNGSALIDATPESIMKSYGWDVEITPSLLIDQGIMAARQMFNRVYFDQTKCAELIECLKMYKRKKNKDGSFGSADHDKYSHGADAFRYLGVVHEKLSNGTDSWKNAKPIQYKSNSVFKS